MLYPPTRTDAVIETLHGRQVTDPYRWLENEHDPEVQAWMQAQDACARTALAGAPTRAFWAQRLRELFYFDSVSAPVHCKGRYFYTRRHADREKAVVYWKDGEHGAEHVLFDPNTWSDDGTVGLGGWWPTRDGRYVAYNLKENNADEAVMHVRDVASGHDLADVIPGTKYSGASWTPDGSGFYYTWVPPVGGEVTVAERPGFAEVRFHAVGTDPSADALVHARTGNPQTFIGGGISFDGHWLVVSIQHGWNATDVYVRDARTPEAPWQTLVEGVPATFSVDIWQDTFYILTNDGAPRYRVMQTTPDRLARSEWRELIPESDATLDGVGIVGGHLVLTYLRNAASEMDVRALDGRLVRTIDLPPLGSSGGIGGNPDEDEGYFAFTSFTELQVIYKTSIATGAVSEWTRVRLPIETSDLRAEQVWYPSKDGTQVSMFILYREGTKRDGTNPTVLYGYGGFLVNMTPGFSVSRAVWQQRGGVYAIPNLRGGGEYGEQWHRDGMLLRKQNVFDDFIAAAEYLVREGWTSPERLAVHGGSNGGLLVGACATQRPDLCRAVVCAVPLLDMLRYHLSGSGRTWIPEYGSADDPAQFEALYAYSPYRVAVDRGATTYPAVLFDSADHDDRVDPLHARKLAAVFQAHQSGPLPILLRIERNAGHGGADMVKQAVERTADIFAFLDQWLGAGTTRTEPA